MKNLQGLHIGDPSASSSHVPMPGKSTDSKQVVHKGIVCTGCSQAVSGIRYKCCFCTDYDLCEDCEGKEGIHDPSHFFAKLRHHVPGIGRKNGEMVPVLKKFVYRMALREESKNERKEDKKKGKDERKEKKKESKKLARAAKKDEKEKRELKRKTRIELRQMRHERDSATALERLQNCLNAEFVADASIPDGTVLKGGQKFLKRWIVKNKGRRWNVRTVLQCVEGNILVASGENKVEVPFLKPDEEGELSVPFIAPSAPGHYERYVLSGFHQNLAFFVYGQGTFVTETNVSCSHVL
ncbi:Next to BRCA1 protein 1 protein [Desmophyllum pertusum]|uniref:Next to BRCA1 protein 1 protein n=1 Tax=Desmophyllum pertusum TaxID=174260 RepID=A0A9X0A2V9_9CNID|nr:Next to BRCA1 protein 1 protein [Desmophyllum pertusum]